MSKSFASFTLVFTLVEVVLCGETSQVSSWGNSENGGVAQGIPGVFNPGNGRGIPAFLGGNGNGRLGGEGPNAFQGIPGGSLPNLGSLLSGGEGNSNGGAYAGGSQRETGGEGGEGYGKSAGENFGKPMGDLSGRPFGNLGEAMGKPFGGMGEGLQRPFGGPGRSQNGDMDFGFLLGMGRNNKKPQMFEQQEGGSKGAENGEAYSGGERNGRTERDPQSTYGESSRGGEKNSYGESSRGGEKMNYQKPAGYGENSGSSGGGYGYGESGSNSKRGIGEFFSNLVDLGNGYAYGDASKLTGVWLSLVPAAVGIFAAVF